MSIYTSKKEGSLDFMNWGTILTLSVGCCDSSVVVESFIARESDDEINESAAVIVLVK
jgi:hypothetical protein